MGRATAVIAVVLALAGAAMTMDGVHYTTRGYAVTLHRDGTLRIHAAGPGERGEPIDYRCTVRLRSPETDFSADVEAIFSTVRSEGFLSARAEYLPPPGTFARLGHDLRRTLAVEASDGTVHRVTFSDQPATSPPAAVTAAAQQIERLVWHTAREPITRACGPLPVIRIGVD